MSTERKRKGTDGSGGKDVFYAVDVVLTHFRMFTRLLIKLKMLLSLTLSSKLFAFQMLSLVISLSLHHTLQIKRRGTISDFCISLFQALTHQMRQYTVCYFCNLSPIMLVLSTQFSS